MKTKTKQLHTEEVPENGEAFSGTTPTDGSPLCSVLGLGTGWPTTDVVEKLCEATDLLLHRCDWDGDGWEILQHCLEVGRQRVKEIHKIRRQLWQSGLPKELNALAARWDVEASEYAELATNSRESGRQTSCALQRGRSEMMEQAAKELRTFIEANDLHEAEEPKEKR